MQQHKGSFIAYDDDSNIITLHVYVDILEGGIEGMKELRTHSGQAVNRLGSDRFEIVATGQILYVDEPQ